MATVSEEKFKMVACEGVQDENEQELLARVNWRHSLKRFLHNKVTIVALIVLAVIIIVSIIGPSLTSYQYDVPNKTLKNKFPSATHIFGTNSVGQDMFVRVCESIKTSLYIGVIVAFLNVSIGVIYGAICVYYGGFIDDIIMRIIEILTSIPSIIFIVQILLVFRVGTTSLIIAMSLVGWGNIGRIMRGQLLQIKQQEYILAAQALGASTSRIIVKHFLTNVLNIAIVTFTLEIPTVIINEAVLGFIGLGVYNPYVPKSPISFGTLALEAQPNIIFYPYQTLIPGAVLSLILICINILGDGLSDALDYRID